MRVIKSLKFAKTFDELYDHFDDDTVETIDQYEQNDFNAIDYDSLEMGEVPITDDNVDSVLVDNLIDEYGEEYEGISTEEFPLEEVPIEKAPLEISPEEQDIVPDDGEGIPEFRDTTEAMQWAINNNRVVKLHYTTKGKGGRNEKKYLKREKGLTRTPKGGVNIFRTVEPYYMFQAGNGNTILVTYDRSIGRGFIGKKNINDNIRAFIVDNINDYDFIKNRKTNKPQYFNPKFKINPNSNKRIDKGIDKMKNINDSLIEMEAALKFKGLVKSASVIKNAEEVLKSLKTAQYVGVQGYWLRNRRCWDNCYRQKRTTQPETPAQEVWMQCWDEYKESINNDKSGWEKYAKRNKDVKISAKKEIKLNKLFTSKVSKKVKAGMSTPEAVYTIIEKESDNQKDKMLESSSQLMELADTLNSSGMKDLGEKLAGISSDMLKEAGIWQGIKNVGKGISNMWGSGKKPEPEQDNLQVIINKLQEIQKAAEDVLRTINRQYSFSSNKNIIIEAGKGTKIVEAQSTIDPQQMAKQKDKRENKQKQQDLTNARYEDNMNPQLAGGGIPSNEVGDPPAEDGPNNIPDGQEDKDKNNIPDGEEDKNKNNIPDGQEDNNQNNVADGEEDNTSATETTETTDQNQDGVDDNTGQPVDQAKQQANDALFKNFRRVYNGVKQHMRDLAPMVSQLGQNSPSSQYLNAALNNFQSFVGEVDNHYNDKTLSNQTIAPLLQNLIKVTMDAQRGLSSGMEGVTAPAAGGVAPAGVAGGAPAGAAGGVAGAGGEGQMADQTPTNAFPTYNQDSDVQSLMGDQKKYTYLKGIMDQIEKITQQKTQKPMAAAAAYNHKLKIMK